MKIKRTRKNTILILAAVVLIGTVVAIAIGYSGEISGTLVGIRQDSPLPLPTEPSTSTPSPTPIAIYSVHIEVTWYDASGNPLSEPPENLPTDFHIIAKSEIGDATCTYPSDSSSLICQYSSLAEGTGGSDDLLVPSGTAYTVEQSGMPVGWRTFAGVGLFQGSGPSAAYTHTVHNRAPRASVDTPTNTPPSAPAQPETPTATRRSAPPPPNTPTPSSTPEPTSTPLPATATPTPSPTSTPTDVPPTSTPTDVPPTSTPTDVPPTSTPTDIPPTSTPTDVPTSTPTDVPPTSTPEPTATPTEVAPTQEPSASPTHTPSPTPVEAAQAAPELPPTLKPETVSETRRFLSSTLCLCVGSAAIVVVGFIVVLLVRDRRKRS